MCQDSVTNRLNRNGYQYVTFDSTIPVDNPGPNDWITGTVGENEDSEPPGFRSRARWTSERG